MILLDVIVGYYMPHLYGWIFLMIVLLIESIILSKFLAGNWYNKSIAISVIISNIITTIIGYVIFDRDHTGGYLLNWVPIYDDHGSIIFYTASAIFITSFIVSAIVETSYNLFALRKRYLKTQLIGGTILVNFTTYALAGLIFWLYYQTHDLYDPSSWMSL